jgi:hypothetical protein
MLTTANAAETSGLACLPKHGGARDIRFLVTHSMTDLNERRLTSQSYLIKLLLYELLAETRCTVRKLLLIHSCRYS